MSNAKPYTSAAECSPPKGYEHARPDWDRLRATVEALERAESSAKSANEQLARTEIAYARAIAELERLGFRRCDVAACNCGGWHQHRPTVVEESLWAQVEALALRRERDHWRDEHEKRRGECLAAQMLEKAAQDRAEANLIDHGLREAALLAERDAARKELAELADAVGYADRPEGQGHLIYAGGPELAAIWKRERREAEEMRSALESLLREEPLVYEGNFEAKLFVSADALSAARRVLGQNKERKS